MSTLILDNPSAAIRDFVNFLPRIQSLSLGVFDREYHERLDAMVDRFERRADADAIRGAFFARTADHHEQGCMHRLTRKKPRGYAGDFEAIDWIYQRRLAASGSARKWDEFGQMQMAPQAVRNRKRYFVSLIEQISRRTGGRFDVLNIGSGPCRDVAEAITSSRDGLDAARFHCVDNDTAAIAYARSLCRPCDGRATIEFERCNALRLRPESRYDLVWSAGLFDYLPERLSARLAGRMWSWTKPGGQLVIGNFHPANHSRRYMEWCLDWHLIHRDASDMRRILVAGGIPDSSIEFDYDETGAVIFGIARRIGPGRCPRTGQT